MKAKHSSFLVVGLILMPILLCGGLLFSLYSYGLKYRGSVVRVTQPDQRLQKAAKIAQRTLPQFLVRLAHPEPGDHFAVKAKFKTPVGPEFLWLKDPAISGKVVTGILDQSPIALPARRGDKLRCNRGEIYDWLIKRKDGSMAGGFTEIALGHDRG